jgi:4-hydroxybenzoate polyprenyltransferase
MEEMSPLSSFETAPATDPARPPSKAAAAVADLARLCRPKQWAKNVFVLVPLVFSGSLVKPELWVPAAAALACFCLLSSAVYCLNDVIDAPADREHPRKRNRPVASGRVPAAAAVGLSLGLVASSAVVGRLLLPLPFLVFAGVYLGNSVAYCMGLKHRVIVDVILIAVGFVLRLLAGCAAIGVDPTSWVLVCGFSLALLLGFGKRRLEVGVLDRPTGFRPVLESYSPEKLNMLLGITSAICLLSYMLYTVAPETVRLHGTDKLVYTVPFVAYGVFRYLLKVQEGKHDGPVEVLMKDPVFAVNAVAWVLSIVAILYVPLWVG